jgi:hypothetical protein
MSEAMEEEAAMPSRSDLARSGSSRGAIIAGPDCGRDLALPVNPFLANHYHFGMLLGVDDLETDQGYHRGKVWIHNAWLHGGGVVWGLGVSIRAEQRQVVVAPGLALTSTGREVYLDREYCVDITRWLEEKAPDTLEITKTNGDRHFTVHVVIGPKHCLDRPVPSIAEPCAAASSETDYSREIETAQLDILPNEPPDPEDPYPRVRAFLGLSGQPAPQEVTDAYADIEAQPTVEQGRRRVTWLRRFAADDVTAQTPHADGGLFPDADDAPVALARVRVHLAPQGEATVLVMDGDNPTQADNRVRSSLIATSTIQELAAAAQLVTPPDVTPPAGEGPRAEAEAVNLSGNELVFKLDKPLLPATVVVSAFTVTALTDAGWQPVTVDSVTTTDGETVVRLTLLNADPTLPTRLIAAGSGPAPLTGVDGVPVAGVRGGPPVRPDEGHDIVLMVRN